MLLWFLSIISPEIRKVPDYVLVLLPLGEAGYLSVGKQMPRAFVLQRPGQKCHSQLIH